MTDADYPLLLLVGVMSHRSPIALGRRNAMRAMTPTARGVAIRFVLGKDTPDTDAHLPDMLAFDVKESGRLLGTYLLTNAFFRYATALSPRVPFIGRADDDALFNPPAVLAELMGATCSVHAGFENGAYYASPIRPPACVRPGLRVTVTTRTTAASPSCAARNATPCAASYDGDLVYGHFREWAIWSPASMQAACFAYSFVRSAYSLRRLRQHLAAGALDDLPRFERECVYNGTVGPFPYAKGPLVVYSHRVLRTVLSAPEIDADEAHALHDRKQSRLRNLVSGRTIAPGAPDHPRRLVVFDDIYYGQLVLRLYANRSLGIVHARISEYNKALPLRMNMQNGTVRIYHKLKTAERFAQINSSSALMSALHGKVKRRYTCQTRWALVKPGDGWLVRGAGGAGALPGRAMAKSSTTVLTHPSGRLFTPGANLSAAAGSHPQALARTSQESYARCCRKWRFCH